MLCLYLFYNCINQFQIWCTISSKMPLHECKNTSEQIIRHICHLWQFCFYLFSYLISKSTPTLFNRYFCQTAILLEKKGNPSPMGAALKEITCNLLRLSSFFPLIVTLCEGRQVRVKINRNCHLSPMQTEIF